MAHELANQPLAFLWIKLRIAETPKPTAYNKVARIRSNRILTRRNGLGANEVSDCPNPLVMLRRWSLPLLVVGDS
jgi:hypothetical protein